MSIPHLFLAGGDAVTAKMLRHCPVHFEIKSDNKGLEGMLLHHTPSGKKYVFGMCEGMDCAGPKSKPGNDFMYHPRAVDVYSASDMRPRDYSRLGYSTPCFSLAREMSMCSMSAGVRRSSSDSVRARR